MSWGLRGGALGGALGCAALAAWLGACGSNNLQNGSLGDGGGGGGDDAATDAGSGGSDSGTTPVDSGSGNGDENPPAQACTAPPFVNFASTVSVVGATDTITPSAGTAVQFTSCAGFQITTASNGMALTKITKGVPLSPLYSAGPSAVAAVGAEIPATTDVNVSALLISQQALDTIPQPYDGKAPVILLQIVAAGTTAPCNAIDGVTLAAVGHPEMVANYMKSGWPTDKTVASKLVSAGPYVFLSGFVFDGGSPLVTLTGAKSGCKVTLVTESQTGRFPLVASAITVGQVTVTN